MRKYELPEYPVMYKMNMLQETIRKKAISDFTFVYVNSGTGRMTVNGLKYALCKDSSFLVNRFAQLQFETAESMQVVIIRISEESVKEFLLRYRPMTDDAVYARSKAADNTNNKVAGVSNKAEEAGNKVVDTNNKAADAGNKSADANYKAEDDDADVEKLPNHLLIRSLVSGIEAGIENDYRASEALVYLKILECLNIIAQIRPELYGWLAKKNRAGKVNLCDFMENHYKDNEPLNQLALASGRSLSTFRRDFIKEFGMPPGKWLLLRRLKESYRLLTQENRQPSSFIFELGFESFSHFSRTFKAEYGVQPSSLLRK